MEWTPTKRLGEFALALPDGSRAGYAPGGVLSLTQGVLTHGESEYRLKWWRVRRDGRPLLTVRPHGGFRVFWSRVVKMWRIARDKRYDDPLVVETGRAVFADTGEEVAITRDGNWVCAADPAGREIAAVYSVRPYTARLRATDERTLAALLVLCYAALSADSTPGV